jgi:response regulator RpfG family c-di-GMP phosphodiesterase
LATIKKKILLVDDAPAILKFSGIKLAISGYDVITASGGQVSRQDSKLRKGETSKAIVSYVNLRIPESFFSLYNIEEILSRSLTNRSWITR